MFLADENIDQCIVDRLRVEGHDVLCVADLDPGIDDEEVLALARDGERVLITSDKDFGELVFRQGRAAAGVLLLRLAGLDPAGKAEAVASAVRDHADELRGAFAVVSPGLVRIRRVSP
jgi:predicted nuclease of predicted toxin-antitoxin system